MQDIELHRTSAASVLTMAVGQNRLPFPSSRGDASGYVEGGLWPKEDVVNFGGGIDCGLEHAQGADVEG